MASTSLDSLDENDKLKLTVMCDVKKICREVGDVLKNKVTFEKPAIELLAEMVWHKIEDYGSDLELFARHAKRTTINADDVKLLVRKNQSLKDRLSKMTEDFSSASKRKRKDKDVDAGSEAGPSDAAMEADAVGNFDVLDFDIEDEF